jgi:hypothetical protein
MQGHLRVAARLACMAAALLGIQALHRFTLGSGGASVTVFETVHAHCIVTLVTLVYYCVGKLLVGGCCPTKQGRRIMLVPRAPDGSYSDMQHTPTEVVWGVPRLTLQNVWILVYGVGFILFVGGYSLLGLQRACLACFGLAVSVLGMDELVCPQRALTKLYVSARCASLLAAVLGLALVSADLFSSLFADFVQTLDLYALAFGLCMPFITQFLMAAVRDSRHYSLGSIFEVCEFGLPFAVFLAVFHLSVAYGQLSQVQQPQGNLAQGFRTDPPCLVFYALAPLLVAPTLVAYVSCVLEGAAIDPLISIGVALCVHYFAFGPQSSVLGIYGTMCCGIAAAVRVLADYNPELGDQRAWGTQLPDRLTREAHELTSGLEAPDTEVAWARQDSA